MVSIGDSSHIFSHFSLLRPQATISVGNRCQLGQVQLIAAESITIDDDVIMSWGVTVLDSDNHSLSWTDRKDDVIKGIRAHADTHGKNIALYHDWSKVRSKQIVIGSKVWIGCNVIILKGVTIGEGAVIGAGSVVTKDIEAWTIAAGNPCQSIRKIERTS